VLICGWYAPPSASIPGPREPAGLDRSAIVAHTVGSMNVGEPIAEVHSEGGQIVIPVTCPIEAEPSAYGDLGEDAVIRDDRYSL
jgi:hypothetical protein